MNHDALQEMIALDALDLLDEAESRALAERLASDANGQQEAKDFRDAAAMLAYMVDPVKPPAALRVAVLAKIREETNALSGNGGAPARANVVPMTRPIAKSPVGAGSQRAMNDRLWRFGAIAAALLLSVCIVTLGMLWSRLGEARAEVSRLRGVESELARTKEQAERAEATASLLRDPEARIGVLAGTSQAPRAHGRVMLDPRTGEALLLSFDLPPVPPGKAYQLWFIADGVPLPGGVFTTDATGRVVLRETVPIEGRRAAVFAITLEDAGGSPVPKGQKYLAGPLS